MVKPESQTRQSNYRSYSSERRLHPDTESQAKVTLGSVEPAVVEHQPTAKIPSPEDIENAFLNYYSNFVGSSLNEKTTWKSENFSQNQRDLTPDRQNHSDPSKVAKMQALRHLKPNPIDSDEFH